MHLYLFHIVVAPKQINATWLSLQFAPTKIHLTQEQQSIFSKQEIWYRKLFKDVSSADFIAGRYRYFYVAGRLNFVSL